MASVLPLTISQSGMYFECLTRGGPDYHVVLSARTESLDPGRLRAALARIVREQPALRSSVHEAEGGPEFHVHEDVEIPIRSFRGLDPSEREAAFREAEDASFLMDRPPLMRVLHLMGEAQGDLLVLVCHHLVVDGTSIALLLARLLELAADPDGDPAEEGSDGPTADGADEDAGWAAYQHLRAPSTVSPAAARDAWREELPGMVPPELSHVLRPPRPGAPAAQLRRAVPDALREQLGETARRIEASEFALQCTAVGIVLGRMADQQDLTVSTVLSDRPEKEMSASIGCFVALAPVRFRLDPSREIIPLIREIGGGIFRDVLRAESPFAAAMLGDPVLQGISGITIIQDHDEQVPPGLVGLDTTRAAPFPGTLSIVFRTLGASCEIVVQHHEGSADPASLEIFLDRLLSVLEQLAGQEATTLAEIDTAGTGPVIGSAGDRVPWEPRHLGTWFLERTLRAGQEVVWEDRDHAVSGAWAHDAAVAVQQAVLAAPEQERTPVAIHLPRGLPYAAAVFGVLLSDAPYVPLAVTDPPARTLELLRECGAGILITDRGRVPDLPAGITRVDWQDLPVGLEEDPRREDPRLEAGVGGGSPEDVAYIEFTSGTSGAPKGVVITHRSVCNLALDLERRFPLAEQDVYLLRTAISFDIIGTELFGWLAGRGRLAVLAEGEQADPLAVLDAVHRHRVTHLNTSPSLLAGLVRAAGTDERRAQLRGLRYLFSGGEALPSSLGAETRRLLPDVGLWNMYGPTEATMWCSTGPVDAAETAKIAPVGTPLNDYRLLVLDAGDRACGVEEAGQICVAGPGLAVGYLDRPDLTAERFTDGPRESGPGTEDVARIYRTGDRGHLRPDGQFQFHRRMDQQVQVGGIRVELEEVEAALRAVPGVQDAAAALDARGTAGILGVLVTEPGIDPHAVRAAVAEQLPPAAVPSRLVSVPEVPLSAAGKTDRTQVLALVSAAPGPAAREERPGGRDRSARVRQCWERVLGLPVPSDTATFFDLGGTSLGLMDLQAVIASAYGREVRVTELMARPTVAEQADWLEEGDAPRPSPAPDGTAVQAEDIAIIGLAVEVPGARDRRKLWELLREGHSTLHRYSEEDLRRLGVPEALRRSPRYVPVAGILEDSDGLDGAPFGLSPAEVAATSPQLRLLYRLLWHGCEDAALDPTRLPSRTGVFVGGSDDFDWYREALDPDRPFGARYERFTLATNHFLATRLAFRFDLRGPALSALAGCSTSLLTVHLAAQSLQAGECDLALAGGVTVEPSQRLGYLHEDGMMLSADGRCRPFDDAASGTVFSDGGGLVVLKRLGDALRDGDRISSIIRGSAVGNDGRAKQSFTAPSEDGQVETIAAAYRRSGIDPADVTLLEAHGTGTRLGDPIEVAALQRVFAAAPEGAISLSSVKGAVGHTDTAAGVVSLCAASLALEHRFQPGTCHLENPNRLLDLAGSPLVLHADGREWPGERPRLAGVNSFGVGGTNVHMILEEAPPRPAPSGSVPVLLRFAAASRLAVERTAEAVTTALAREPELSPLDAAATLAARSPELDVRGAVAWMGDGSEPRLLPVRRTPEVTGPTALLFSGQGNQHPGMGSWLAGGRSLPARRFAEELAEVLGHLEVAERADLERTMSGAGGPLDRTDHAQLALFSTQYAAARAVMSLGVEPDVLLGHSIGELTAAALAGVWTLPDALHLVRRRGRLMQEQPPGVMIAVPSAAGAVREAVAETPGAWVALENAPERTVIGLDAEVADDVERALGAAGLMGIRLRTSHAFHTPMMTSAAEAFAEEVARVPREEPRIPIIANRRGRIARPGELTDPQAWAEQIARPVLFSECLGALGRLHPAQVIESGPGTSLLSFVRTVDALEGTGVQTSLLPGASAGSGIEESMMCALGELWTAGLEVRTEEPGEGRRTSLPGYVFDPAPAEPAAAAALPAAAVEPTDDAGPTVVAAAALPAEAAVLAAVTAVLGHEQVDPETTFLALGGDSLKATALVAHLESEHGLRAEVAQVLSAPSLRELAVRCDLDAAPRPGLPPAPRGEDHPLSSAQLRMYLAARLDPDSPLYNMLSATRLAGTPDVGRLRAAMRRLVARHEPLRTRFDRRGGEVRQVVVPAAECPDPELDLVRGDVSTSEEVAARAREFLRPFDLGRAPLLRGRIVDGGPAGAVLLIDVHHIVADGTAVEVLARDLGSLWDGDLRPLDVQFVDHVEQEQRHRDAEREQRELAEVVATLEGYRRREALPLTRTRDGRPRTAERVTLSVDPELLPGIRSLAVEHEATVPMVMLAAWSAALARVGDLEDLVIGTTATGRDRPGTGEMVGMFVNLLPIRLRPRSGRSFRGLLEETREGMIAALAHQQVPFDAVVGALAPPRADGANPLTEVSFDFHNIEEHDLQLGDLRGEQVELPPFAVGMDLVITGTQREGTLGFDLDIAADLVDRETVAGLAAAFHGLLRGVLADPDVPLGECPLLGPEDLAMIRAQASGPWTEPISETVHRAALEDLEATALIEPDGTSVTRGRLDRVVASLAARLRASGLRRGDPVVLWGERDGALIAGMLAALRAGGCYLPLDPSAPAARRDLVLADLGPRWAIAPAEAPLQTVEHRFGTEGIRRALRGEEPLPVPSPGPDETPQEEDPAYLIYTSGSTGTPKGVRVAHRGVSNLLADHHRRELFRSGDVIVSLAEPTFDIFLSESLIPLAEGAAVHLCPSDESRDAAAIAARIQRHGATHLQVPVSKLTALCGSRPFRERLSALRTVIVGGEHVPPALVETVRGTAGARLLNMYGPTECTVTSSIKELEVGREITIGTPVDGAATVIVDEEGRLLPPGLPGEIVVLGRPVSLGYTHAPDTVRAAFDPLPELPGMAAYRTGDLGRIGAGDGELRIGGRRDHQVKHQGNRIELGEIEKTAAAIPGIELAVALLEEDRLVLVVSPPGPAADPGTLRQALAERLPAPMLPQQVLALEEIPLGATGKADRTAIAARLRDAGGPGQTRPEPGAEAGAGSAPAARTVGELETLIRGLWEAELGARPEPRDGFFDLGGTSLGLMNIGNRLADALGEDVPLAALFDHPTPRTLAASLAAPDPSPAAVRPVRTGLGGEEPLLGTADLEAIEGLEVPGSSEPVDAEGADGRVAVIGIALRVPGAATAAAHWDAREQGTVGVRRFSEEELIEAGVPAQDRKDPRYVPVRGWIAADTFDHAHFGYSVQQAEALDPQVRLLHELAWDAFEDAAVVPGARTGRTGVFVGTGTNLAWTLGSLAATADPVGVFASLTATEKDFVATRIAHRMDLTGPAMTVQTACSTSLVAVHEAVRALRAGECETALAGGAALNFPRREGYPWREGMIFSRRGACRPFSRDADGTVPGQGGALVLLKPLDAALAAGDHVYAVIAGSAVNNDGGEKVGYTAPGARGQRRVMRDALADAGVDPAEVGYVETHGTGTPLGDPLEFGALAEVYGGATGPALGAVKASLGHLDAAAGVVGLIGAIGALHRETVWPLAALGDPHPALPADTGLRLPTALERRPGGLSHAAVSSFGIGGTNAHVVLARAPRSPRSVPRAGHPRALLVSGSEARACRARQEQATALLTDPGIEPADLAVTLAVGRAPLASRAVTVITPGQDPLWWTAEDPAPVVPAADRSGLSWPGAEPDAGPLAVRLDTLLDELLGACDAGARERIRAALGAGTPADRPEGRLAQVILRAALLRLLPSGALDAGARTTTLLGPARDLAAGTRTLRQVVDALRETPPASSEAAPEPRAEGPVRPVAPALDERSLLEVLAGQWVRGVPLEDPTLLSGDGRRIPLPGYPFAPVSLRADIHPRELQRLVDGEATAPAPPPGSADDRRPASAPTEPAAPGAAEDDAAITRLREAWTTVLGGDAPGAEDDFLRAGGDSLTAVRMCTLLEDGVGLDAADVLGSPRFTDLAALLGARRQEPAATEEGRRTEESPGTASDASPEDGAVMWPASPAQRRMYASSMLLDDPRAFDLRLEHLVHGPLDPERLAGAVEALMRRHDQLRADFQLDAHGTLTQRIHSEPGPGLVIRPFDPEVVDRFAPGPAFDLGRAPLFRASWIPGGPGTGLLRLEIHHLIGDQASLEVLGEELVALYAGQDPGPAPLPYTRYARALEEPDGVRRRAEAARRVAERVRGVPPLELRADGDPAQVGLCTRQLGTGVEEIAARAAQEGTTPFAVLLAAATAVLAEGHREDVLVGTAVSGRTVPGTDRTVGMFVSLAPLRLTAADGASGREALAAAAALGRDLMRDAEAPIEDVAAELGLRADSATSPLFDVVVNVVEVGGDARLGEAELEPLAPARDSARHGATLTFALTGKEVEVEIEHRGDVLSGAGARRMLARLDAALASIVRHPEEPLAPADPEPVAENGGGSGVPGTLVDHVLTAVGRHASRVALEAGPRRWTYRELLDEAAGLAGALAAADIGPGTPVAVLLTRGPEQIIARLALLLRGALEIPLDRAAPAGRIGTLIRESGARAVLLDEGAPADDVPGGLTAVSVAARGPEVATARVEATAPILMIFTSGTTGTPKGTLLSGANMLTACVDTGYLRYRQGHRVLQLTASTFDASYQDLYGGLCAGATLVMGGTEVSRDPRELARFLREERIDAGLLITPVFHALMEEDPAAVAAMSVLHVGGEALGTSAARAAVDRMGPGRLVNLYGPTETAVAATYHRLDSCPGAGRVPIGRAARHRLLRVVDLEGRDLPPGEPGELWIGGHGVALGYHGREDLTAERFPVRDGERYYRSGDRVVLEDDGNLVFVDRFDRQIKHAGHRIELAEIEYAMETCTGVESAVVVVTSAEGASTLTGFCTGADVDPETVRRELASLLPVTLVPQHLLPVDRFPLTPHGKVDHRALADRIEKDAGTGGAERHRDSGRGTTAAPPGADAPLTDAEGVLSVMREVLLLPELGPEEDIFAAGAQSIQAIALSRELRRRGLDVPVAEIFRRPCAAQLAPAAEPASAATSPAPSEALCPAPTSGTRTPQQAAEEAKGLAARRRGPVQDTLPPGAVFRWHDRGVVEASLQHTLPHAEEQGVRRALSSVLARHDALRMRREDGRLEVLVPEAMAGIEDQLPLIDLGEEDPDAVVRELLAEETELATAEGLLWRLVLLRIPGTGIRLLWRLHHGIFDAASAAILQEEIEAALEDRPLPPEPAGIARHPGQQSGDWPSGEDLDGDLWGRRTAEQLDALRPAHGTLESRFRVPLGEEDPWMLALQQVVQHLQGLTGGEAALAVVSDCRSWRGEPRIQAIGEFLDLVPVLVPEGLEGEETVAAVADRLDGCRRRGEHHLAGLEDPDAVEGDPVRDAFRAPERPALVLLNYQGVQTEAEPPRREHPTVGIADVHVNAWSDGQDLHLHWICAARPDGPDAEEAP
ncbi:non-ribosomal peptide synthetase/type I polyketide synthase [Brachybacterium squillarum]|uniref:non-ribosomal peptide synthetase/type I polyketide synthase n=1 Tax=Brachybacterium squillarum TaxID=661979 RepID=UPI0024786A5C|nr:non-ribosomal peptide synthetase/type I polyketide synthase [Brachybacterium squillarum]